MDEKQRTELLAFARKVLDGFPQKLEDLLLHEWPDDPRIEREYICYLAQTVRDTSNDWRWRELAYEALQEGARYYAHRIQSQGDFRPEDIPHEWLALSFQVFSGMVEQPKASRGQKKQAAEIVLRDDKILMLYEFLRRDWGCKSTDAEEVVAEAAHLSIDGARDVLKRTRKRTRGFEEDWDWEHAPTQPSINIWGEEIPDLSTYESA